MRPQPPPRADHQKGQVSMSPLPHCCHFRRNCPHLRWNDATWLLQLEKTAACVTLALATL